VEIQGKTTWYTEGGGFLGDGPTSVSINYAETLVTLDRDNNWVPCLAENVRWVNERTIDFKLRTGVKFHNGENFNADAVKVNWEAYCEMESPRNMRFKEIHDATRLEIIDQFTVRFTFHEPEGLAFPKF
jgi:peptide/nickel transport system substrate-binding protein